MAVKTHSWISLWFLLTVPVIAWDVGYCMMRLVTALEQSTLMFTQAVQSFQTTINEGKRFLFSASHDH